MMHLAAVNTASEQFQEGIVRRCAIAIVNAFGGAGAASRRASKRRMRLIETLPLGAKRQLLLVTCDGESFLIGTGAESVQSILRVRPAERQNDDTKEVV